ncbi:hypothetical protein CC80DRAFT_493334 [Byssothecium circinans]|uniref:Uncharacterized protein n=1 Tax=Byssothecium circinans TaxID=147558 RepID=A0A6A5TW58_9PLEO|nr:hypothetical protein CC80DRAFT_493334 [Byssothecium circinans]
MTTSTQNPKRRLYAEYTPSNVVYHLWAYPEARAPKTTVYLKTIIPAMVTYVLGPTWKTEIGSGRMLDMPTAMWTDADEVSLALRILRAGGAVIDLSDARGDLELTEVVTHSEWIEAEKRQKYLFGWPESGGVWVLGLPQWAERDPFEMPPKRTGALTRHYNGSLDCSPLKKLESMEEFCSALKKLGAQYYDNADVSDEVREFGLLKEETILYKKKP